MNFTREECIHRQRDALAQILRDPIEQVTNDCIPLWPHHDNLENILLVNFSRIPYCAGLYALDCAGRQITGIVRKDGILSDSIGRDRSQRPYMKHLVPAWGFLLSDIYISQHLQRPVFTALQLVRNGDRALGYLGADFALRDLPLTSECLYESNDWKIMTNTPGKDAGQQSPRAESSMDKNLDRILQVLEKLLAHHGVFQCQLHFASSQVIVWLCNDPYQYRILGHESLTDSDSFPSYPQQPYPAKAAIPQPSIKPILSRLKDLRLSKSCFYLRHASINVCNGMLNLSVSCDGAEYLFYTDFLQHPSEYWLAEMGIVET